MSVFLSKWSRTTPLSQESRHRLNPNGGKQLLFIDVSLVSSPVKMQLENSSTHTWVLSPFQYLFIQTTHLSHESCLPFNPKRVRKHLYIFQKPCLHFSLKGVWQVLYTHESCLQFDQKLAQTITWSLESCLPFTPLSPWSCLRFNPNGVKQLHYTI